MTPQQSSEKAEREREWGFKEGDIIDSPVPRGKLSLWKRFKRYPKRRWKQILLWKNESKFERKHGFKSNEILDFPKAHSEWVLLRLRWLYDNAGEYPDGFKSLKGWKAAIKKMIFAFEVALKDEKDYTDYPKNYDHRWKVIKMDEIGRVIFSPMDKRKPNLRRWNALKKRQQVGFELFYKWYDYLYLL